LQAICKEKNEFSPEIFTSNLELLDLVSGHWMTKGCSERLHYRQVIYTCTYLIM